MMGMILDVGGGIRWDRVDINNKDTPKRSITWVLVR